MGVDVTEKRNRGASVYTFAMTPGERFVDVGILAAMATVLEESPGDSAGPSVLEIANWNEFGLGVPERPFVRGYVDAHAADVKAFIVRTVRQAATTGQTKEWALERIGLFVVSGIQRFIGAHGEGSYPENAPATIKAKSRQNTKDTPLIDTGLLWASLSYAVGGEQ